ncbi:MAG: hypothetical protein IKR56_10180 [Lachnospiraceae bacterium]|nr:hypothetical protein [Lachnospiraceae bacterium]MBR4175693.1 hypothetical protein [Lachnospiraceae bacterium]
MKSNASYRNMFDVLLAIFFVSWMFFEVMILGNKFDILRYSGLSGKLIVIIGRLVPTVVVYMFMVVWQDVKDAVEFLHRAIYTPFKVRTIIFLLVFIAGHIYVLHLAGESMGRASAFWVMALPYAFLNAGFAEVAWSGFIFPCIWNRISFIPACMITGFLYTFYSLPLWRVEGVRQELGEFSHYMIYCCYACLVLGCVYRLTESIIACVIVRVLIQAGLYFFEDMIFGSPKVNLVLFLELVILLVIALVFGKKKDTL